MVKKDKTSSENDDESSIINENGKRQGEEQIKDGKKRLKTKGLYRQPTVRELNRLQETENLFNSNLFRLQIEEVLEEVNVKEKTIKRFQDWFKTFKEHLLSIPEDSTEYDLSEKTIYKKLHVKSPIGNELNKTKCMFRFYKFQDVEIVGSYALGCSINSKLIVDVQIIVPGDTYTKNDSVNYKYHKKRGAYLAVIASHLQNLEIIEELKYTYLRGCTTKPVIDVKPSGKLGNTLSLNIYLVCDTEVYKLHRFSPLRNNLRETWLLENDGVDNVSDMGPPTPYYNSSVLHDITFDVNQKLLNETFVNCENLKQAVVLLKIWLRQRRLQLSGYVTSMFVAYLVQIKRINNIMSSYQIIRNVWIALQSSDWDTKGISLYKGSAPVPSLEEFQQHFPVVFIDKSGYYNLCWNVHKGTYTALKQESSLAIEMLDNPKLNHFIPLFMTPVHHLTKFDHIIRFKNIDELKENVLHNVPKEVRINYGVSELSLVIDTIYTLLSRGLGNRADLILQLVESDFSWSVKKNVDKVRIGNGDKLAFGLVLNSENVISIVDKGPPANLPEAEEFRAFWGEKSELRRFQDGSITEACVWNADDAAERRALPKQIVNYLMKLKYGVSPSEMYHVTDQLDRVLECKRGTRCGEERCAAAVRAFDELRRDMRALTQLPLDVSAVHGISPVFSYSCPLPPAPACLQRNPRRRGSSALIKDTTDSRLPPYTPVSTAIIELSHSGKWPGDIDAFRCLKAAFHIQIADCLTKQYCLPAQPHATHVDVLKNDFVYRLKIAHSKEITLLQREMENGVVKHRESEESLRLQRETVLLPKLRGALHGLHQRHPAFGPGARLFKRWLCAHLLSPPHFPDVVSELVVAAVFVRAAPLQPPAQPLAALARTLRLLADTDWRTETILLDFNGDMSQEEVAEVERALGECGPGELRVRIASSCDGELRGAWARDAPTPQVLRRACTLAASTLKYLEGALLNDFRDSILGIFVPSLSGYDALMKLAPGVMPHASARVGHKWFDRGPDARRSQDPMLGDLLPVLEFDPVARYLDELRSAYDEFALFFHDCYGGDVIAVLWRPDIDQFRELQVANANALKPVEVDGEVKYKVNKEALLEDFRVLGRGVVTDVTVS